MLSSQRRPMADPLRLVPQMLAAAGAGPLGFDDLAGATLESPVLFEVAVADDRPQGGNRLDAQASISAASSQSATMCSSSGPLPTPENPCRRPQNAASTA